MRLDARFQHPASSRALRPGLTLGLALVAALQGALAGWPSVSQARGWQRLSTLPGPAPYVLQVAVADLDGDGGDEVIALGRNYELQEDRLYVLGCRRQGPDCQLTTLVEGPRLLGPLGNVALAAGRFTGQERAEILTASGSSLRLWVWTGRELRRIWEGSVGAPVEQAVMVQLPGLTGAVAMALVYTQPVWHKRLAVFRWGGSSFEPLTRPVNAGPVRSMAALDLLGDGLSELVLEIGEGNGPGSFQLWRWDGSVFARAGSAQLRHAAVFALGGGPVHPPEGPREQLLVADNRGQVALYAWQDGSFTRIGEVQSLGWSLVSAVTGDLDGDGIAEAVVVEYPNLLHLLRWQP